jgi:hypothetical protein
LELPRNCTYFIFVLKAVTEKLLAKDGIQFPLDIIMYIVTFNAIIGEFKGMSRLASGFYCLVLYLFYCYSYLF